MIMKREHGLQHLTLQAEDLVQQLKKIKTKELSDEEMNDENVGEIVEEIKQYLLNYIKIVDETNDNWYYKQFYDLVFSLLNIALTE